MALDTTVGGASADSYGSLAEADAYFAARQTGNWDGSDASKEMALRKAVTYLDNVYRGAWKGLRAAQTQALAWPRYDVIDEDGFVLPVDEIPEVLKRAQFEAADLIAEGVNLEATIERPIKREKVGPLEVEYMDGAAAQAQYQAIHNYLRGLILRSPATNGGFGTGTVMRA